MSGQYPAVVPSVDPITSDRLRLHYPRLVIQPLLPSPADLLLIDIGLGQLDKKMIVACLAFHKSAIKLAQVFVPEPFTQPFESFAAAGLDKGEYQQPVQETLFYTAPLFFKFKELIDIQVFSLGTQFKPSFIQLGQHQPEMSPFFRDDGG